MDLALVESVVDFAQANWLAVVLAVVACAAFSWRWIGFLFSAAGIKLALVLLTSVVMA